MLGDGHHRLGAGLRGTIMNEALRRVVDAVIDLVRRRTLPTLECLVAVGDQVLCSGSRTDADLVTR